MEKYSSHVPFQTTHQICFYKTYASPAKLILKGQQQVFGAFGAFVTAGPQGDYGLVAGSLWVRPPKVVMFIGL